MKKSVKEEFEKAETSILRVVICLFAIWMVVCAVYAKASAKKPKYNEILDLKLQVQFLKDDLAECRGEK